MKMRRGIVWVAGSQTPAKVYITRVFNFGTWQEMKKKFSPQQIEETVKHPFRGCWTRRGRAFAEALYHYSMPDEVLISYDA